MDGTPGFSPVSGLEWVCNNFQVVEAPLRTPWNSRLDELFRRPLETSDAGCFVAYVKSLNHADKGCVDLYMKARCSEDEMNEQRRD